MEKEVNWNTSTGECVLVYPLPEYHLAYRVVAKVAIVKNCQIQSPGSDPSRLQTINSNDRLSLSLRDVREMVDYPVLGLDLNRGLTADIWMVRNAKCIGMSHSSLDRFPALLHRFHSQIQYSGLCSMLYIEKPPSLFWYRADYQGFWISCLVMYATDELHCIKEIF